jgi:cell cycle serine/threonine-protein kinase CDC5/MSD2
MLRHPGIVRCEGYLEHEITHAILLEYCSGGSLKDLLKRRKYLTELEVQNIILQVLGVVEYMHANGIIHRDLQPANIFLQDGFCVKIGDFGIATKLANENDLKTYDSNQAIYLTIVFRHVCGSLNYMSPELLDPSQPGYGFENDVWAIGILMYKLLVGIEPFRSKTKESTISKIKNGKFEFPAHLNISNEAQDVIRKILSIDPSN